MNFDAFELGSNLCHYVYRKKKRKIKRETRLIVELHGHRLFTASQGSKSVMVFDVRTHKLIHTIGGIEIPHGLPYREELKRLYVTDGSP